MILPGGYRGLCRVRAMLESLGTTVWARARSLSRWYSLMQPPASRFAADVGVEPQPQHITEHAIVFHCGITRSNKPNLDHRFSSRESNQRETRTAYFRIDASFYGVDEIRSQTLHLPKSDPRDDVLAHHDGRDELLAVLLGRHAQQSTGWPEREAHHVRIILL